MYDLGAGIALRASVKEPLRASCERFMYAPVSERKLGAWEAQDSMAMFVTKIPADANADQLVDAIEATVNSADEVEKEITGDKDEY